MARLRARLTEVCPELVADIDAIRALPGCEKAKLVRLVVGEVEMGEAAPDPASMWRIPATTGNWEAAEAARNARKKP